MLSIKVKNALSSFGWSRLGVRNNKSLQFVFLGISSLWGLRHWGRKLINGLERSELELWDKLLLLAFSTYFYQNFYLGYRAKKQNFDEHFASGSFTIQSPCLKIQPLSSEKSQFVFRQKSTLLALSGSFRLLSFRYRKQSPRKFF